MSIQASAATKPPLSMDGASADDGGFDFSVVVNVHSGGRYLRRTMMSPEEASRYARGLGIRTELVVVLDRSPADTRAWIDEYTTDAFDGRQVTKVDNGSLGLSRNDGLRTARGDVVCF